MKKNKHIGSTLDEFLEEEGMLEEIEKAVAERIFTFTKKLNSTTETPPSPALRSSGR